jgi:hypothetical protein
MKLVNIYQVNKIPMANNNINANTSLSRMTKSNSVVLPSASSIVPLNTQDVGRSRWGPAIWYLFHTMAHKIKGSEFSRLKVEMLDIIQSICANLPCPACASHATEYMKRLNYSLINNKDDFKIYLCNFHNDVNRRKGIEMFPLIELDKKYAAANTINIVKNFIAVFQFRNGSFNMIANDMQRQRQAEKITMWFNNNIQSFDP